MVFWISDDIWMYRNLERNITDGTVYKMGEPQQLSPVDHPLLQEQLARMLARCAREIISNVADRIIVPRESVADVFDAHLSGCGTHVVQCPRLADPQRSPGGVVAATPVVE